MLMQVPGIFEGIAVFETLPWREIGLTAAVLLGAWLIRRIGRLFLTGAVEDRAVQYRRGKTLAYFTLTLTTVVIIAIWVDGLSQIGTFLGLALCTCAVSAWACYVYLPNVVEGPDFVEIVAVGVLLGDVVRAVSFLDHTPAVVVVVCEAIGLVVSGRPCQRLSLSRS